MTMAYEPRKISENFYEIVQGGVRCFLMVGGEFALLIDTGFGGDLRSVVEKITSLPVKVIHTHSDRDHIGGSGQFEELYMNSAEFACCADKNKVTLPLRPIWEGDCIRVGEFCLEVIFIPGHTPGSIALLERRNRFLISGDSVQNGTIYMFGDIRSLLAYEASLRKLQNRMQDFDTVYASHGDVAVPADTVSRLLTLTSEINRGVMPEPKPAPEHLPKTVKIYGKDGVQLYLQR